MKKVWYSELLFLDSILTGRQSMASLLSDKKEYYVYRSDG